MGKVPASAQLSTEKFSWKLKSKTRSLRPSWLCAKNSDTVLCTHGVLGSFIQPLTWTMETWNQLARGKVQHSCRANRERIKTSGLCKKECVSLLRNCPVFSHPSSRGKCVMSQGDPERGSSASISVLVRLTGPHHIRRMGLFFSCHFVRQRLIQKSQAKLLQLQWLHCTSHGPSPKLALAVEMRFPGSVYPKQGLASRCAHISQETEV